MEIRILDGNTVTTGDLSWNKFNELGNLTVYSNTSKTELLRNIGEAEIILANKVYIDRDTMNACSKLKYIGILATGLNNVDLIAAKEYGLIVTNIPAYSTESVAQMVFAHILNFTQGVAQHSKSVQEGKWSKSQLFCFWEYPLIELKGKILGIIGGGRIGQATAAIGKAFGMEIIFYTPRSKPELLKHYKTKSFEEVITQSDFLSLHCPLNEETANLINEKTLKQMKSTAYLIDTGRGGLVDEQALANALNNETIAGAGLDVLYEEPPRNGSKLIGAKNCYITPHNAWATIASRSRLMDIAYNNVKDFLEGNPVNVVV